jgi:hypothetical protein
LNIVLRASHGGFNSFVCFMLGFSLYFSLETAFKLHYAGLLTMVPIHTATGSSLWLLLESVMDKQVKYRI